MATASVANVRQHLTPPQIARRYNVATAKVIKWIQAGDLAALNLATGSGGRPRYSVSVEALAAFEAARSVRPAPSGTRRVRTASRSTGKEYV